MLTKLMFYFDLCGFCTEYSQSIFRNILNRIIFFIQHVFLVFSVTFIIYKHILDNLLETKEVLANDAMRTYTALLTHWLIITESYGSRKSQHKYWTIFNQIQQLQNKPQMKLRKFTVICALNIIWTICSMASFMYQYFVMEWQNIAFSVIFFTQTQVFQNRIHFYSLYLNIVYEHLDCVLRELDIVSHRCTNNTDLRMLRIKYVLIVESIDCINHIFGWSNAVNILFSFNMLLSQINWFIEIVPNSPISTGISKNNVFSHLF